MNPTPEDIVRFFSKVKIIDNCWNWQAGKDKDGYGRFRFNGKTRRAHRFSYETFKEDIPDGLQLDHLCRNRACVNPEHLEPVTNQENITRGLTGILNQHYAKRTHCEKGHPFTKENTLLRTDSGRRCRICTQKYNKQYKQKLKRESLVGKINRNS